MMTAAFLIITAFVVGFLLGDRRGVRQANEILDHNNRVLIEAIAGEHTLRTEIDDSSGIVHPTVH